MYLVKVKVGTRLTRRLAPTLAPRQNWCSSQENQVPSTEFWVGGALPGTLCARKYATHQKYIRQRRIEASALTLLLRGAAPTEEEGRRILRPADLRVTFWSRPLTSFSPHPPSLSQRVVTSTSGWFR